MEGRRAGQGCDGHHHRAPSSAEEAGKKKQPPQGGAAHGEDARRPPSGKGFLRPRPWLLWLRRRRAANPREEGQAASRSRLCVEAAHESPIQAVRKPSPGVERLAWHVAQEESAAGGERGPSLLRQLLCLKAASCRPKENPPPRGAQAASASPLFGAPAPRCGPVAALSRAADPQGESPLRWKAAPGSQGPAQAPSATDPPQGAVARRTRPWQVFRQAMASRAKRRPLPPKSSQQGREDGERGRLGHLPRSPPGPRGKRSASGELPGGMQAGGGRQPLCAFPHQGAGDTPGPREDARGCGSRPPGAETHRTMGESMSESGGDMGSRPEAPHALPLEKSPWGEGPIPENAPEWERLQAWACALPGRSRAGGEGAVRGGCVGAEGPPDEEPALAELAENPGGQGMLMGTRDLGWLHRELLGGATLWTAEPTAEEKAREAQEPEEENSSPGSPAGGGERSSKAAQNMALDAVTTAHPFLPSPPWLHSHGAARPGMEGLRDSLLEEAGTLSPGSVQGEGLLLPWGFSSPSSSPPSPVPGPSPALPANTGRGGEGQRLAGSKPEVSGAKAKPDMRMLHWAAVEIVGAAIDAAANQLAQTEEQEQVVLGLSRPCP